MLVTSIFSFSQNVFTRLLPQGPWGKGVLKTLRIFSFFYEVFHSFINLSWIIFGVFFVCKFFEFGPVDKKKKIILWRVKPRLTLPNKNILDWSKFKTYPGDRIKLAKIVFLAPLAVDQQAYVMARCPSCIVSPSVSALTFSLNIFFSETTYRILMKFQRNVPAIVLSRTSSKNLIPSKTLVAMATELKNFLKSLKIFLSETIRLRAAKLAAISPFSHNVFYHLKGKISLPNGSLASVFKL